LLPDEQQGAQLASTAVANAEVEMLYPAVRAIEAAAAEPGARPTRFFAVLLPFWSVEVGFTRAQTQEYDLIDRFLDRAVGDGRIADVTGLAGFLGVDRPLVERAVGRLCTLGHLTRDGDALALTALGRESLNADRRHLRSAERTRVFLDAFRGSPLPRDHYSALRFLGAPSLSLADGTRFRPVVSFEEFRPGAVHLPGVADLRVLSCRTEWLPVYLVRAANGYLAYSRYRTGRDPWLERLCAGLPELLDVLDVEPPPDEERIWRDWLDGAGFRAVHPKRQPNGVLRAVLPPEVFGTRFGWAQLGGYVAREGCFMQLWCDDEPTRRRAERERALT
jgi:hypothetical protein